MNCLISCNGCKLSPPWRGETWVRCSQGKSKRFHQHTHASQRHTKSIIEYMPKPLSFTLMCAITLLRILSRVSYWVCITLCAQNTEIVSNNLGCLPRKVIYQSTVVGVLMTKIGMTINLMECRKFLTSRSYVTEQNLCKRRQGEAVLSKDNASWSLLWLQRLQLRN